jgi:MFS family permease
MNKRLFLISCISLVTTAMVFAIRGDIAGPMSEAFHITNEQLGLVFSPAFWAFTVAIFIGGALADIVGMRSLHMLSAVGYVAGVLMVILAPHPTGAVVSLFDNTGTTMLYAGFFIMGLSQGLVEAVINPLIVTIYSDQKTKYLVRLHAWWPGGLVIGGLLAAAMSQMGASWQLKLSIIMVPGVVYLFMALSTPYPQTERVTSNVSTGEMWGQIVKPLYIVLFICMWMTAAAELGPDQWFPKIMTDLTGLQGVLFLVYTAGLMFLLRSYGSAISHKSPLGTMIICSALTFVGLYWLGSLRPGDSAAIAFVAATIFGVGKTFFWPTMLGITSEQFPRGGALLISVMGGAGMLSAAAALPIMGKRIDDIVAAGGNVASGGGAALQMMAWLGAILVVAFALIWFYFKSRGGYKAVPIGSTAGH